MDPSPLYLNRAITINQCFNATLPTSQAAVFAYFTISRSIITGHDVNLAGCEVFSLFHFAFRRAGVCHHGDKKSCRPWMATFIPKHHLSECFRCLCSFLFFSLRSHVGPKGWARRNGECPESPPWKDLCTGVHYYNNGQWTLPRVYGDAIQHRHIESD